jgi:hypothetical protein
MAPDAARMVDDLRPLHAVGARCLLLKHVNEAGNISWKCGLFSLNHKTVDASSSQPL